MQYSSIDAETNAMYLQKVSAYTSDGEDESKVYMTAQQCLMPACSPRNRYRIRDDCFAAMMPSLKIVAN